MEAGEESELWLLEKCLEIATILASRDSKQWQMSQAVFFVKGEARKSLSPGPSQALTCGWTLSVMRALPTSLHVFTFPAASVCMPIFQRGWHSPGKTPEHLNYSRYYEGNNFSNLKEPSGLRQKGEVSVMLIQLRWDHTQIMKIFDFNKGRGSRAGNLQVGFIMKKLCGQRSHGDYTVQVLTFWFLKCLIYCWRTLNSPFLACTVFEQS